MNDKENERPSAILEALREPGMVERLALARMTLAESPPQLVRTGPCGEFEQADGEHERRKEICKCGWPLSRHDTPAPWERS